MPNPYFQFKQFTVQQDQCAMKVCTDSCVLGAHAPVTGARRILDIGAGTGLLSLMLAQRAPQAMIEAVEIDPAAAAQAAANLAASPWAERLLLHPMSLQEFTAAAPAPFDMIISNPPFFQASLKSADTARNTAKHTGSLTFKEIIGFAERFLSLEGHLHILLPPHEARVFAQEALAAGFYTSHILWLEATPQGKLLRAIHTYTRVAGPVGEETLAVREKDHTTYTLAFRQLLQDYYLIF
ncbi:tRNA1(Val) (adenine(37)-N6)-methyltransferase [Rufibacter quisquiliarum]|uniref:tRNA1(Val) (adenine(37)-N6)-methyltransferase n=1 Tax=Rufibacter quisquiliarum TaxID=1549639 RepID=A0A839G7X5_9BACT|nr:methyltransferase [Rufibacter quisquiliarum]MBA9075534.1 tRNA1Val (adenine37-N6)-methyltransferase [Rufibacter quisquiliarum]